ncbi:Uma2 family endonuclease [Candidatus Parabeggiatoa sp. HSG14]|uniref:Uma2 family endonuclease n=1 Tax=Candidatus Parabeggiatoa sp. HSG14 TaxID=3055593 RepID=UPI0025A865AC|nr:Uma2 family endonuclease [Thiotrichales bacterium HSG14]
MTTPYAIEVKAYQGGGTTHVPYAPPKKQVTEAEYWEKYYDYPDKNYEWNNGFLEEKPVSEHVTYLTFVWFLELVNHYLKTHSNADLAGLEMGFRMVLSNKMNIRKPDFGVVLKSNPIPLLPHDSSYHGTFDMCIEAISESSAKEVTRDTVTKKAEYAQAGVKEYVILDGNGNHTAFYHLNTNGIYVPVKPSKGDIIKSKVLPGFQFRIADLYKKPSPEKMIEDPIYQGFVLPGYSEAKKAKQEAEKRADKAEQQAKRLAAKLQELGINPEDI